MGLDRDATRSGRSKGKKPLEAPTGRYFALPHSVLDSEAWRACTPAARALLMELCRQHTGSNNGHLHIARDWLAERGWTRPATTKKLIDELQRCRLLIQTRRGGLNRGPHWYALSWLSISDWRELNLTDKDFRPGSYLLKPPPKPERKKSQWTPHVLGDDVPRTPHVLVEPILGTSPRTPHVHNEYNHSPVCVEPGCKSSKSASKPRAARKSPKTDTFVGVVK